MPAFVAPVNRIGQCRFAACHRPIHCCTMPYTPRIAPPTFVTLDCLSGEMAKTGKAPTENLDSCSRFGRFHWNLTSFEWSRSSWIRGWSWTFGGHLWFSNWFVSGVLFFLGWLKEFDFCGILFAEKQHDIRSKWKTNWIFFTQGNYFPRRCFYDVTCKRRCRRIATIMFVSNLV